MKIKSAMISVESGRWKRRHSEAPEWIHSVRQPSSAIGRRLPSASVTSILCGLLYCAVSSAQQQPVNYAAALDRALLARSFTSEKLWIWQNRLNLTDWNISVILSPAKDLKPHTLGHIRWDLDTKTAVIRVLDPEDYHLPQNEVLRDMEFTIVHELIHLNFGSAASSYSCSEANRVEDEQAVNRMVDALLKLDRKE